MKNASKKVTLGTAEANGSKSGKNTLHAMLLSLGVCEEHIPTVTKKLDDLVIKANKVGSGNDSSIDEPDVYAEAVHLDEFEALFRVAPAVVSPDPVTDFKINRKPPSNGGMKVKVSGGLPE